MITRIIGWLLGIDNVTAIGDFDIALSAAWAKDRPFYMILAIVCLFVVALLFYLRFQQRGSVAVRIMLGSLRGLLLTLLLLTLAAPVLRTTFTSIQPPSLYVLIDGTESMAIADELPEAERARLSDAVELETPSSQAAPLTRVAFVQALLTKKNDNLLAKLQEEKKCRVETFVFTGNSTSQVRRIDASRNGGDTIEPAYLAEQLRTDGQVTAIGPALTNLGQQLGTGNLAGVVMISDFANNSGMAPLGNRGAIDQSPVGRLGVPIYAVGVGATEALDLSVDIQTDPKMKRAERTNVLVKLRQSGLSGRSATVRVFAQPLGGDSAEVAIGQKTVTLESAVQHVDFPFTPTEAGRFEFVAEVQPLDGEVVDQNNRAAREVNIIDDYLRLMYAANEPDWEWRFVKEVFHRDKLVGMQGFRTYLGSSDPRVRDTNVLFLSTLTPRRSEFFANDVIFLGDMPQTALSDRFCAMTKEYVGQFGGGLVVIAGPRFGLRELYGTPLADMLPVVIDPEARIRDDREFRLRLTPQAAGYPFMNLGGNDVENAKAWDNLGDLQWYQPVRNKHELADVLAAHPTDLCSDGKTPQPLIAVRRYGKGEVVYVGFNEMWRLRRRYGEKYYREFWSQLIYRLGMSHALGTEKRFVVRTDRQEYNAEEKVTLTVEAFDENFEPLTETELPDRALTGELIIPGQGADAPQTRPLAVPALRSGIFEAQIPVYAVGQYTIRVKDPVTGKSTEVRFEVASVSAERRSGVRNARLQEELAAESNGRSYDLTTVSNLIDDLQLQPRVETSPRNFPLWCTPLWFGLIVVLMLSEWLIRKFVNLT